MNLQRWLGAAFLFLVFVVVTTDSFARSQNMQAKLTPYQQSLQRCLGGQLEGLKLNTHSQLYEVIVKKYPLISSETLYREVVYRLNDEDRKLKFENSQLGLYSVDPEGAVRLLSTENFLQTPATDQPRQKRLSPEARMDQLLFRASIKSDYRKTKEQRLQGLVLNVSWSGKNLKNLQVEFSESKKVLSCSQSGSTDICICKD